MITKNDCVLLLTEIQQTDNIDTSDKILRVLKSEDLPIDIIKFINDSRQLDLSNFYEKIRKSYNNKKSNLYINIVKDIEDPNNVLTTLSSMQLQILLFAKKLENKQMFLRHARAEEISLVLGNYFKTYDIKPCIKLLRLIKADLKVCEYLQDRDV